MKLSESTVREQARPRVCALFPGALGDFICVQPALLYLAERAQLTVFSRSDFADLLPVEVTVESIERAEIARLFIPGGSEEAQVRGLFAPYGAVFSWAGATQPVFKQELQCLAPTHFFPFRCATHHRHQSEYYFSCVAPDSGCAPLPGIPLREDAIVWWEAYREHHSLADKPLLVLAPGSGAREKNWPAAGFAAVAAWWAERIKGNVLTLIGPVEEERGNMREIESVTLLLRKPTLAQAAALLSRCDFYLGNDSGITHLAGAVGAPTLALFGPSDPKIWAPRGRRVTALSMHTDCSPCSVPAMKNCMHHQCLASLRPEQVIAKMEQLRS